jgi:hypothetical protein
VKKEEEGWALSSHGKDPVEMDGEIQTNPPRKGKKKCLVAEMTAHQHTRFRKNLTGKGHNRGQALFSKSLHSSLHDISQASSHH